MKIKLITLAIAALTFVSCNKSTFNVNVDLQNAEGKKIYLQKFVDKKSTIIDSVVMKNNVANFFPAHA